MRKNKENLYRRREHIIVQAVIKNLCTLDIWENNYQLAMMVVVSKSWTKTSGGSSALYLLIKGLA